MTYHFPKKILGSRISLTYKRLTKILRSFVRKSGHRTIGATLVGTADIDEPARNVCWKNKRDLITMMTTTTTINSNKRKFIWWGNRLRCRGANYIVGIYEAPTPANVRPYGQTVMTAECKRRNHEHRLPTCSTRIYWWQSPLSTIRHCDRLMSWRVPQKRTRTRLGDRNFSIAGPCLRNSLPVALRDRDISLVQFKRLLKTLWFV